MQNHIKATNIHITKISNILVSHTCSTPCDRMDDYLLFISKVTHAVHPVIEWMITYYLSVPKKLSLSQV